MSTIYGVEAPPPDYVVVELRHDSRVTHSPGRHRFEGHPDVAPQVEYLNGVLRTASPSRFIPHFRTKPSALRKRVTEAPQHDSARVTAEFAHAGFVHIVPSHPERLPEVIQAFNASDAVWSAFRAARPVLGGALPIGHSRRARNFQPAQGYLFAPPIGVGAMGIWSEEGGKGRGITVCEVEGDWNRSHTGLPRGISLYGGRLLGGEWKNHGTAVLGLLVSQRGASGTIGICHEAQAAVQSFVVSRRQERRGRLPQHGRRGQERI